jgi:hypothetical protein
MTTAFIRFDEKDEAEGLDELTAHTRVDAYRGGVYAIPDRFLEFLDKQGYGYRIATDQEVEAALAAIRRPFATPVQ